MPGRRSYNMGKRQAAVEETKRRIIEAAAAEYATSGIEGTSMQAVARRADVASGTVLYHYETPDDLVEAVVASWLSEMKPPSADSIDPGQPIETRVSILVSELFALYQRSEVAYQVWAMSAHHPVLLRYSDWWDENVSSMLEVALGDHLANGETAAVVSALIDPFFRGTLLSRGIGPERVTEIATHLVLVTLGV